MGRAADKVRLLRRARARVQGLRQPRGRRRGRPGLLLQGREARLRNGESLAKPVSHTQCFIPFCYLTDLRHIYESF